nr:transcriptional repressor NF-X1 [Cryptococcus tetragattii IND107]
MSESSATPHLPFHASITAPAAATAHTTQAGPVPGDGAFLLNQKSHNRQNSRHSHRNGGQCWRDKGKGREIVVNGTAVKGKKSEPSGDGLVPAASSSATTSQCSGGRSSGPEKGKHVNRNTGKFNAQQLSKDIPDDSKATELQNGEGGEMPGLSKLRIDHSINPWVGEDEASRSAQSSQSGCRRSNVPPSLSNMPLPGGPVARMHSRQNQRFNMPPPVVRVNDMSGQANHNGMNSNFRSLANVDGMQKHEVCVTNESVTPTSSRGKGRTPNFRPPPHSQSRTRAAPSVEMQRTLKAVKIPQLQQTAPMDPSAPTFIPGAALLTSELDENPLPSREEIVAEGCKEKKSRKKPSKKERSDNSAQQTGSASVSRRRAFEQSTKLTSMNPKDGRTLKPGKLDGPAEGVVRAEQKQRKKAAQDSDDLVGRLTKGLRSRPFVECPICFNSITPSQAIWCCLPPDRPPEANSAVLVPNPITGSTSASSHYSACYTPFHLECIKDWAERSLQEEVGKVRDGLKEPEEVVWRCPGCQKRRSEAPKDYRCFCGRLSHPATSLSAPHSCGDSCGRTRQKCTHPCPLPCHPGPCPPCNIALIVPCPSHNIPITVKCSSATSNNAALSPVCDDICGKPLGCGHKDHLCLELCHYGPCQPCMQREVVKCYCGEDEKEVDCGWNRSQGRLCARLIDEGIEETWEGRFNCGKPCEQLYDCGIHMCHEVCHPHAVTPYPCPLSPAIVTHCPCGATPLSLLPGFPRPDCLAPIPTCTKRCPKTRPCGHPCPKNCHSGECPPCHEEIVKSCRCGQSQLLVPCDVLRERRTNGLGDVTCERVCKALRNCGRHECGRLCCPLWEQVKFRNKKQRNEDNDIYPDDDLHKCHLICGKTLSCGRHTCPKPDHKGPCGRCLQASYDELICHCGRTVVYPPVACGTKINCAFPCARPASACGHPKIPHQCHEEEECPPCPYLTTKQCACGKDPAVKNVRCSQDRVSCGQPCGELLSCGFHKCQKLCHRPGECDSCNQVCGKPKSVCKHPCTAACHAPAKCPENDPCQAIVTQTCACGHLQSRTSCGASNAHPKSRELDQLKCNSECSEVYEDELKIFAVGNHKFVKMVETTFEEFFKGPRQMMILPHMPAAKRTFVMALADHYRLTRELIDQEPNRSVQIRRRIDTRIPKPLLSSAVQPPASQPRLVTTMASAWGRASGSTAASVVAGGVSAVKSPTSIPASNIMAGSSTVSSSARPSRTATPVFAPVSAPVITQKSPEARKEQEMTYQNDDRQQSKDDGTDDWDVDV